MPEHQSREADAQPARLRQHLPEEEEDQREPGDHRDDLLMDCMEDRERREHAGETREERGEPPKTQRQRQGVHAGPGQQVVPDDHELQPGVAQRTITHEQREEKGGEVEHRRLNVGEERHPVERVRVPERELPPGERRRGEAADRIAEVEEILPEIRVAEKDVLEEEEPQQGKETQRLPVGDLPPGRRALHAVLSHGEASCRCQRRGRG